MMLMTTIATMTVVIRMISSWYHFSWNSYLPSCHGVIPYARIRLLLSDKCQRWVPHLHIARYMYCSVQRDSPSTVFNFCNALHERIIREVLRTPSKHKKRH